MHKAGSTAGASNSPLCTAVASPSDQRDIGRALSRLETAQQFSFLSALCPTAQVRFRCLWQ